MRSNGWVRHVSFQPMWQSSLLSACSHQERDGYGLLRVIPVNQWEAIAVFEKIGPFTEPDDEDAPSQEVATSAFNPLITSTSWAESSS